MNNIFYVYEWFNIETKEVFYVGKGKNKRYKDVKKRNDYFKNYYNKYKCDVRKVIKNISEKEAFDKEIELIKEYRLKGQCKCNLSNGGEGCTYEDGTWNDLFRKLQYRHDIRGDMDDMRNEEDYDAKALKSKSLDELKNLYEEFMNFKENKKDLNLLGYNPNKITGLELKFQNEEIIILTNLLANKIASENDEFKKFLGYKDEVDFICHNIDTDKFIGLILSNYDYNFEFIKTIMNVLEFMKSLELNSMVKNNINVRSYNIKDNYIHIKFNTINYKPIKRVKINMYDIIWGILMDRDKPMELNKPLYQLLYEEIFVAPFINL